MRPPRRRAPFASSPTEAGASRRTFSRRPRRSSSGVGLRGGRDALLADVKRRAAAPWLLCALARAPPPYSKEPRALVRAWARAPPRVAHG
eukprot:5502295-Alexandrium_andersonii.AAC.1